MSGSTVRAHPVQRHHHVVVGGEEVVVGGLGVPARLRPVDVEHRDVDRPERFLGLVGAALDVGSLREVGRDADRGPPTSVIAPTVSSTASSPRAVTTTFTPSRASSTAMARPIPLLPPDTRPTLPSMPRSIALPPWSRPCQWLGAGVTAGAPGTGGTLPKCGGQQPMGARRTSSARLPSAAPPEHVHSGAAPVVCGPGSGDPKGDVMFGRVAVVNRGEPAVRFLRADRGSGTVSGDDAADRRAGRALNVTPCSSTRPTRRSPSTPVAADPAIPYLDLEVLAGRRSSGAGRCDVGRLGFRGRAARVRDLCRATRRHVRRADGWPPCAASATRSAPSCSPSRPACRWRRGAAGRCDA